MSVAFDTAIFPITNSEVFLIDGLVSLPGVDALKPLLKEPTRPRVT